MTYVCIGAGISSLMFSYRLLENLKKSGKEGKIIILEKGKKIELRKCPILEKKVDRCIKCRQCAIVSGEAYTNTITADTGKTLGNVYVYMGGVDVTSSAVTGGAISIAAVTGDVAIIAAAS